MGVDVINTIIKERNIDRGLFISFVQGSETFFSILVVGVGHGDGKVAGSGTTKKGVIGERYHNDQYKERKSMGYVPNRGV
jgi:hypothetical protein